MANALLAMTTKSRLMNRSHIERQLKQHMDNMGEGIKLPTYRSKRLTTSTLNLSKVMAREAVELITRLVDKGDYLRISTLLSEHSDTIGEVHVVNVDKLDKLLPTLAVEIQVDELLQYIIENGVLTDHVTEWKLYRVVFRIIAEALIRDKRKVYCFGQMELVGKVVTIDDRKVAQVTTRTMQSYEPHTSRARRT